MRPGFALPSRTLVLAVAAVVGLLAAVVAEALWTRPVRQSLNQFQGLMLAAVRQDVAWARSLCSERYLSYHGITPSEDGLIGLPRRIDKNYQAWRQGANVWICPTNTNHLRVGPIYQFVYERGAWRFDGLVGRLLPRGQVELIPDEERNRPPSPALPGDPESESF